MAKLHWLNRLSVLSTFLMPFGQLLFKVPTGSPEKNLGFSGVGRQHRILGRQIEVVLGGLILISGLLLGLPGVIFPVASPGPTFV